MRIKLPLSIASGVLLGLCTGVLSPLPVEPLAWIALVPILMVIKSTSRFRDHALYATITGFFYTVIALYPFIKAYYFGGLLLILVSSLHFSGPLLLWYPFKKEWGWSRALFILPLLWTVWEWYFMQSALSMPLMTFTVLQARLIWLIQYIDLLGATAITFWLVLLNGLIALALDRWITARTRVSVTPGDLPGPRPALQFIGQLGITACVMFAPPLAYSAWTLAQWHKTTHTEVRVGLIQPNMPARPSLPKSYWVDYLRQCVTLTDQLADQLADQNRPDLILWPEGSLPLSVFQSPKARARLFDSVLGWKAALLTGTYDLKAYKDPNAKSALARYLDRDYEIYNAATLITPQLAWRSREPGFDSASLAVYHKQNLMPFAEYVPFSDHWPWLSRFTLDLGRGTNFTAGQGPKTLNFATANGTVAQISPIICWDLFYGRPAALAAAAGAECLGLLTDESRLGPSVTAQEMEGFTRLRSIETRRSIAKCSNTGHSLITDPLGRIRTKVPWWQAQTETGTMVLCQTRTFFSRYPGLFPDLCLGLLMMAAMVPGLIHVKQRLGRPA